MNSQEAPLLSVWIITYNHEKYIKQCLDSVLTQKTNFAFEIVIGEDCSTDGTRAIIQEFERKYPGIIKPIYHDKNVGAMRNAYDFCYPQLKGKYIACLEGDDYWTDPLKLQKQVDFLENHRECSFCFHQAQFHYMNTSEYGDIYPVNVPSSILDANQFFLTSVPTASLVFRNTIKKFPDFMVNHSHGDYLLACLLISQGKAGFIPEPMSVYRKHEGGISYDGYSEAYIKRRIKELRIEKEYFATYDDVARHVSMKYTTTVLGYLKLHDSKISINEKLSYLLLLLRQSSFYKWVIKRYILKSGI